MKRIGIIFIGVFLTVTLVLVSGCYGSDLQPKDIYKKHIALASSSEKYENSYTEYIANEKSGAVITVYSAFEYRNNKGSHSYTETSVSGIILNNDGYILTSGNAVRSFAADQASSLQYIEASSYQIMLNPIYEDEKYYRAKLIDYDETLNIAVLKFFDNFFYYTDTDNERAEKGFQFKAEFYDARDSLKTGDHCAFVGDALGMGVAITAGVISSNKMSVLGGIVFNNTEYFYIQSSAALNSEMLGGALYDKNGYIIGMASTKVSSDTDNTTFNKVGLALPSACVIDYINTLADDLQLVIEFTVAEAEV